MNSENDMPSPFSKRVLTLNKREFSSSSSSSWKVECGTHSRISSQHGSKSEASSQQS